MYRPSPAPVGVVGASFVVAYTLAIVPMPDWAMGWRPPWVALVLFYWSVAYPERIGVLTAWVCGLVLDALVGTLLGQHALGLAVVVWLAQRMYRSARMFPVWQQAVSVFLVLAVYQLLVSWVSGIRGLAVDAMAHLTVPLLAAVVWPWMYLILRSFRRAGADEAGQS